MANKEKGEFTLVAGDEKWTLRLTTNGCCELEDRTGKTVGDIIVGINRGSMVSLRWFMWACLQDKHGDVITEKHVRRVGEIIDAAGGLDGTLKQINEFIRQNMNPSEEAPEAGKQASGAPEDNGSDPSKAQPTNGVAITETPLVSV